jgi:hypothetical protein
MLLAKRSGVLVCYYTNTLAPKFYRIPARLSSDFFALNENIFLDRIRAAML